MQRRGYYFLFFCIYVQLSVQATFDFNLRLTNGQLTLINKGVVSPLLLSTGLSKTIAIPGEVNQIDLLWWVTSTDVQYDLDVVIRQNNQIDTSVAFNFTDGFSGTVPTTSSAVKMITTCSVDGTFVIELDFHLENGTNNATYTMYLTKECQLGVKSSCDACGECYSSGGCECTQSVATNAFLCNLKTTETTSDISEQFISMISYNTRGAETQETSQQIINRYRDIAKSILDEDYSIICLQGVFTDDGRQILIEQFQADYPFMALKTFGNGPNPDSGLFMASKYPIVKQDFYEFSTSLTGDISYDKGVYGALFRLREDAYVYVFNTELQSLRGVDIQDVQQSQLQELKAFIDSEIESASKSYPLTLTSVVLVGDFNVDSNNRLGQTISYDDLLSLINDPKDASSDSGPTYFPTFNCTSALASAVSCTQGTNTNLELRVDYVFRYSKVVGKQLRGAAVESVKSVNLAPISASSPYGSRLSDHNAVRFEIDMRPDLTAAIAAPVVIGGTILIITGLILFQVYYRKKPIPAPQWAFIYARQTRALFIKNWILTLRNKRALTVQLSVPFVLVALIFLLQYALVENTQRNRSFSDVQNPSVTQLGGLPRCQTSLTDTCYTFAYTASNDTVVNQLMRMVAKENNIPDSEIKQFVTTEEADLYLRNNINSTQGVYHVTPVYSNSSYNPSNGLYSLTSVSYVIQYNSTVVFRRRFQSAPSKDWLLPMQRALERVVLQYKKLYSTNQTIDSWVPNQPFDLRVSTFEFAHPALVTVDVIGDSGPSFFFGCLMFNFVIQMGQLVTEKELKLREAMAVVGLRDSIYWLTWFVTNLSWNTLSGLLLILAGSIFQFNFFLRNDFALYFFLFFLFGLSMVAVSIFLSLFLTKSRTATSVGFVVFLVGVIAQVAAEIVFSPSTDEGIQVLLKLLPFCLLSKGMNDLGDRASSSDSVGLRWSDRYEYGYFPLGEIYNWLIIDFFLYFGLAMLYDFLFGGVHGESRVRRWIFKQQDNPSDDIEMDEQLTDDDVRAEADMVKSGKVPSKTVLSLKWLKKTYRSYKYGCVHDKGADFTAVKGLWLHVEDGQLFCLLGHNGAGKSTTISMLTGLLQASGGDAEIFGHSLRSDVDEIRKVMGVCPQFDILWNELTAAEHIRLFGALKGLPASEVEEQVTERLSDVELTDVSNVASINYSGGMKRRLSVAIALTGGPKIVFLDEPTTGMDPVSRRQVWNLLEKEKKKRLVILTTHSMEEADMLGDNIAIMKRGQLICLGTALHLKTKFGSGYRVAVVAESATVDMVPVQKIVQQYLPSSVISQQSPGVVHYEVPLTESESLPVLLRELETNGKSYGILDVQVGMTSLEDVFLKVAGLEAELPTDPIELENEAMENDKKETGTAVRDDRAPEFQYWSQFRALWSKSFTLQRRQYRTNACQILFPFLLIIILFAFQILVTTTVQNEQGKTTPAVPFPPLKPTPFYSTADFDVSNDCPVQDPNTQFSFDDVTTDKRSGRLLYVDGGYGLGQYGASVADASFWSTLSAEEQPVGFLGNVTRDIRRMVGYKGRLLVDQGARRVFCFTKLFAFPISFANRADKSTMDDIVYSSWARESYLGGYTFDQVDLNSGKFHFSVMYNDTLTGGRDVPALVNLITDALFKVLTPSDGFTTPGMTMQGTRDYPSEEKTNDFDIISLIGPAFYIFIFQLFFPVVLGNLVYEKEFKLREIMKMMGLKPQIYWVVNYVLYLVLYMVAMLLMILIAALLRFRFWTVNDFITYFLLIFEWGNVMIAMAFFFSVFFTKSLTATVFGYISLFVTGLLASQLIQSYFSSPDTPSGIIFVLSLIPQFALYRGFVELGSAVSFDGPGIKASDLTSGGNDIVDVYGFLAVEWIVLMVLALYFEQVIPDGIGVKQHWLFFLEKSWWIRGTLEEPEERPVNREESADVAEERKKVWDDKKGDEYVIRMLGLRKVYKSGKNDKIAVNNLSFGIEHGECFGLLGPNGSGKSTTCNMLCGYFGPTEGSAKVAGFDIRSDIDFVHLLMGVCPQDNIIWEELTGAEHLAFYGKLKNLYGKALDIEIKYRLQQVDLYNVRNKKAGQYSGGMKRRLCVAISLMGRPRVTLMDEPSTGLDPKARTNLWEVIRTAKKTSCVMLTTHSMEEAEALCERVGIFVNGDMRSIGTPARLKSQFGEDFKLTITTSIEHEETAHKLITQFAPHALLFNNPVAGTRSYKLAREKTKLSEVFMAVKDWGKQINITDWGISNVTLEEVFLQIALAESENAAKLKVTMM